MELREAALKWIKTFVSGLAGHTDSLIWEDGTLRIQLKGAMVAEIATRSRVPVSFELETEVTIMPAVESGGEIVLHLRGLIITPVDGAIEVFNQMKQVWNDKGVPAEEVETRGEIAWTWWQKMNNKERYQSSKIWRIVDSLAGLSTARMVPRRGFEDLLMGCLCVTRTRPTSLRYSHYDGKAQVTCETEHDPAVLDSSTILYDPECEWKEKTAQAIAARNVANPSTRDLAERFARSGINFSCLFAAVNTTGVRGANPAAVVKLFELSQAVGGANAVDRAMGALKWQRDDETFKMTGDHGRLIWRRRDSRAQQ